MTAFKIWSEIQGESFVLFIQKGEEVFNCAYELKDLTDPHAEKAAEILKSLVSMLCHAAFREETVRERIERQINELKDELVVLKSLLGKEKANG